ncbi:MAG: lipopolysaccharide kinase InaA family protein [Kiritimatiellia bacterium]
MSTFKQIGRFQGEIDPEFDTPAFRTWLQKLPDVPECEGFSAERDLIRNVRPPGGASPLALKKYVPPPVWKSFSDEQTGRGSRARRAFAYAQHLQNQGVPTPRPIAWLEFQQGRKVVEQYFISEGLPGACTLRGALLHHYYENPLCSKLMELLNVTAKTVRLMHAAGFEHRDLGNQNILVRRNAQGEWAEAWVIDLHRGVLRSELSSRHRGKDNARITLPSDLRRVFFEMQFEPSEVPAEFLRSEKRARSRYQFKRKTHSFRHPFDVRKSTERQYPPEKDLWIWDDRSRQAIPALRSKEKRKYYRKQDLFEIVSTSIRTHSSLKKAFAEIKSQAWTSPLPMKNKIGLSLNLEPDRFEKERKWLKSLGPLPLLVRLYHHESESNQRFAIEAVRKLTAEGHPVSVALVQDRRALTVPASWANFVENAGGGLSGFVESFEIGHAINRVKWGIWNIPEYRQFLEPFRNWNHRYPQIPLMGPAGIDFEFPRILPMLNQWPANSLSAFSHHMYVDRRGDPENRQSGFDTVDKLAWARAIARVHPACAERVVVSEVNWPLSGTGVWSPVGSPYQSPGIRHQDPSVDEETYARFMKKYYLLALCSGMADQVFWWNLAAHGFGLIDDRDPNGWRPRPAFHVFKNLVDQTRDATFLRREADSEGFRYVFAKDGNEFEI